MTTYTIQSGDTLSAIADQFGFSHYQPIWKYNSQVRNLLKSGNPDRIDVGIKIFIPRTAQQYDGVIEKMKNLRQAVQDDFREIGQDLNSAKKETDQFGEKLDLVADLAMVGKGALKATVRLGSKRLRNHVLKKKAMEAAQKVAVASMPVDASSNEGMVIDKSTAAAVDNSIMIMAKRNFDAAKAKDKFAKGMTKGMAKKGAVMITKGIAPVEHANGVAEIVSTIADALIGGLEAVKPTSVAKTWIWLTTGESPDDAYDKANRHIAAQQKASLKRVEETITKLTNEKTILYS